jgi:DNA polymerase-3 subunit delta
MDSRAFLDKATTSPGSLAKKLQPVYVLYGDEDFLKRQVVAGLRKLVFETNENEFGLSTHAGDKADFAAVRDELETVPFLSPRRMVVVENADPFVTRFRAALERYLSQPAATGILVLDVKSWPSNTKLYKMVDSAGAISCKAPPIYKLPEWCMGWAKSCHGKELPLAAARLLVDLVGAEMGVLDQELTKLAIYVGSAPQIKTADVDKLVGSSRTQNTFKIFDAIGAGRAGEALAILGRLFDQGEEPLAILGAIGWQLRRLAKVVGLRRQGIPLYAAMERAGVQHFAQQGIEQQLRHLGPQRADRLYDWLLETDFGLKGASQLPPRTLLERLVVRLARSQGS